MTAQPLHITDITPKSPKGKLMHRCRPILGVCLAILSALMLVLTSLFAKLCTVLPVFEIGLISYAVQLVINIPPIVYSNDKVTFSPKITILLVVRGLLGVSNVLIRYYAVQNMPLGDATVLAFTSPVFVAVFAKLILKERLHWIYGVLLVLSLAGVTMIARPTFIFGHPDDVPEYENIFVPSLLAVLAAVIASFSMITLRVLGINKVNSTGILFYYSIIGVIFSIVGSYLDKGFQFPFCESPDYLYAVCVGIFLSLGQAFVNEALRRDRAFIVSLARSPGIVFGFLFQVLIFSLIPSGLSLGGAAMITLCNIVIFVFKWYQTDRRT